MEKREVTIGQATYEVGRFFVGMQPVEALVLEQLLQQAAVAEAAFDLSPEDAV